LLGGFLAFVYVAALLIAGDRDGAYNVIMIIAVAFTELVRPLKFRWLLVLAIVGSAGLGIAFLARNSPRRDPISMLENVIKEADHVRWDMGFEEAGASAITLFAAANYVPEAHDFYWGRMQVTRLAGFVPFGGALVSKLLQGYIDPRERDSPTALTYLINKQMPGYKQGSGLGTTCVADIYLDFGVPGVVGLHFLLGMLCKLFMQKSRSSGSLLWMGAYLMAVPAVGYAARDCVIACLLRYVWWQIALFMIISFVFGLTTRIGSTGTPLVKRSSPRPFGIPMRPARVA
jgi:hypothetical protein